MAIKLDYHEKDGILYPNLKMKDAEDRPLGKYGRLRRKYLVEQKPYLFQAMLLQDTLWEHLLEIDETGLRREEEIMNQLAAQNGVNEQLKADDPLLWVRQMNNFQQAAQEILMNELIYT